MEPISIEEYLLLGVLNTLENAMSWSRGEWLLGDEGSEDAVVKVTGDGVLVTRQGRKFQISVKEVK